MTHHRPPYNSRTEILQALFGFSARNPDITLQISEKLETIRVFFIVPCPIAIGNLQGMNETPIAELRVTTIGAARPIEFTILPYTFNSSKATRVVTSALQAVTDFIEEVESYLPSALRQAS